MDLLSIVPKQAMLYAPPSETQDYVLVTKREARRLKTLSPAIRAACFQRQE